MEDADAKTTLEAKYKLQQTTCGRTSWQPFSVKMLLERAERLRLLD